MLHLWKLCILSTACVIFQAEKEWSQIGILSYSWLLYICALLWAKLRWQVFQYSTTE